MIAFGVLDKLRYHIVSHPFVLDNFGEHILRDLFQTIIFVKKISLELFFDLQSFQFLFCKDSFYDIVACHVIFLS